VAEGGSPTVKVHQRWPRELVARVDAAAGLRGRTEFTVRALERALSDGSRPRNMFERAR
jgi:hypothetical protein